MREKALFVTGDRAEYDLLKPVAKAMRKTDRFDVGFFVAGTHSIAKFGNTFDQIEKDGFKIITKINNLLYSDAPSARAKSLSIELSSLVDTMDNYEPKLVVILGDREETLAAATACTYSQTLCVHLCGGDVTSDGNSDNLVRDAVTKLSHVHFPTTKRSRKRIEDLGEDRWRIFNFGATGLDSLRSVKRKSRETLLSELGAPPNLNHYAILIQHPILSDIDASKVDLAASLQSLQELEVATFIGRPNSDPGNAEFYEIIDNAIKNNPKLIYYRNLNRTTFVNLLRHSSVLVGNSSAGIIEAPYLKLPVVNVGLRQRGREAAENVFFAEGQVDQIKAAISRALYDENYKALVGKCKNPYGNGYASNKIAQKLVEVCEEYSRFILKRQV
ncbi:UDP-N-acetylglucosamine 2-epimerase [Planktomarina temperata]|nr:UDP-N-acetylglucosamine 2-epimerase [Planktomarina temperata]